MWGAERNKRAIEQQQLGLSVIKVRLEDMTVDEINYTLSRFITEVINVFFNKGTTYFTLPKIDD